MQYKIPVQIENEDKIFLQLSIRQLSIIMIGGSIAYSLFKSLRQSVGDTVAIFPAVLIVLITLFIALFKNSEMTFLPFITNLIRLNINSGSRSWQKGTDSHSGIEIGYIKSMVTPEKRFDSKHDHNIYQEIEDKLHKI
ncbi:PrgI family protein [Candidatus Gracilibacteria bacterium]|nr:PrgI family protein [Candidatus Gracilibacteria bacterium]